MDLWDNNLWILLFTTSVCTMGFVLANLVGLATFVESTTYSVNELKTAYLFSLSEDLANEFRVQPVQKALIGVIELRVTLTEVHSLAAVNVELKVSLG